MRLILSSNSPRRKELLSLIDIPFQVRIINDIDESYSSELPLNEVAEFISQKKALAYVPGIQEDEVVLTADTVVILDNMILGKPKNEDDALQMLRSLSGKTHQVITGVTLTSLTKQRSFSVTTDVTFRELSDEEINYYVDTYKPLDKAGAYGIQEYIGAIGVVGIKGSYFNVVGLPVARISEELKLFV